MNKLKAMFMVCGLVGTLLVAQGCALFVVGAAAGAAAGTVSYFGNELRVIQEVSMDRAWDAANGAVKDLEFPVNRADTRKDATLATIRARNAKDQPVIIELIRKSDKVTEIRIRVGSFDTTQNRATAQLVYDKMRARM